MKLIVGLGNPGSEYQDTRHNIGFMVVDKLAKELTTPAAVWDTKKDLKSMIARAGDIILAKPTTYMNNSGLAVKAIMSFYKLEPGDIWVIHDDIDLPLGKIRIREGGSSAGHNGIESIMKMVGTDKFLRFRLGIGRGKEEVKKHTDQNLRHRSVISFVLSRFRTNEAGDMRKLIKYSMQAVQIALTEGTDKAMNRYN